MPKVKRGGSVSQARKEQTRLSKVGKQEYKNAHAAEIVEAFNKGVSKPKLYKKYGSYTVEVAFYIYRMDKEMCPSQRLAINACECYRRYRREHEAVETGVAQAVSINHKQGPPTGMFGNMIDELNKMTQTIERLTREVEQLTPYKEKYDELLKSFNEATSARVAADSILAHRP